MSDRLDFPRGELRARVVRGTVVNATVLGFVDLLVLAQGLIVTRLLGPEAIGLYGVVTVTAMTIVSLKRVGIDEAFVAQEAADQETEFQHAFTLELLLSAGFALVLLASAPVVAAVYDDDRLLALTAATAYLPLAFALQSPAWVFFRRMDYARQRLLQAVVPVVAFAVTVPLAAAGVGVWSLVIGPAAGNLGGHRRRARRVALSPGAALRPRRRAALPALLGARLRLARRGARRRPGPDPRLRRRSRAWPGSASSRSPRRSRATSIAPTRSSPRRSTRRSAPSATARGRSRSSSCAPTARRCCGSCPRARAPSSSPATSSPSSWATSGGRPRGLIQGLAVATAMGQLGFNWFSFYRAHERTRPPAVEALVAAVAFCALAVPGLAIAGVTGFVVGRCAAVAVQLGVRARYVRALLPAVRARDLLARPAVPTAAAAAAALALRAALWGSGRSEAQAVAELALFGAVVVVLTLRLERGLVAELISAVRRAGPAEQEPGEGDRDEGDGGHLPVPVQAGVQGPGQGGGGGAGGQGRGRRVGRGAPPARSPPAAAASSARPTSPRSARVWSSSEWALRTRSSIVRRRSHSTANAPGPAPAIGWSAATSTATRQ